MIFFFNKLLYLFFLLPILIIFLLYNYFNKKPVKYPSIIYFNTKSKIKNKYFKYFRDIIRLLLIILVFILTVFYISIPSVKSNKVEYLVIYVDNTPFGDISNKDINTLIDSLKNEDVFSHIKIYTNYSELNYPLINTIKNQSVISKQNVLQRFYSILYSLKTNSIKYVFISDRKYSNFDTYTVKHIERNKIFIYDIMPNLVLFSNQNSNKKMQFFTNNKLIYEINYNFKKYYNYFYYKNIKFNKIIIEKDTFSFNEIYKIHMPNIELIDTNFYIEKALKILGYKINKNSSIKIAINRKINKGICFSKYGKVFIEDIGKIIYDKSLFRYNINLSNLSFKTLANDNGTKVIYDTKGNILISKVDSVYFVNIPIDTGYSNFVFIPEFVYILDYMIKSIIPSNDINNDDKLFLEYNYEASENKLYNYYNSDVIKSKNIQNIILIGVLICISLLFIFSFFL